MHVEYLKPDDRADVVEVLTDSFYEYPVFRHMLEGVEAPEYRRRLELSIGFFTDARFIRDWPVLGIREHDQLQACLLLSEPGSGARPELVSEAYERLRTEVGNEALARLEHFDAISNQYAPKAQTYFVGMIGVRPGAQRRGYGRLLMEYVEDLSRDHPDSIGVTLTTEVESNLAFYDALGYRVLGTSAADGYRTWFLILEH